MAALIRSWPDAVSDQMLTTGYSISVGSLPVQPRTWEGMYLLVVSACIFTWPQRNSVNPIGSYCSSEEGTPMVFSPGSAPIYTTVRSCYAWVADKWSHIRLRRTPGLDMISALIFSSSHKHAIFRIAIDLDVAQWDRLYCRRSTGPPLSLLVGEPRSGST